MLKGEKISDVTYKLSDENAEIIFYVNDKKVENVNSLKNGDILKIVTIDSDDNKLEYEVVINEMGIFSSFIVYAILFGVLVSPFIGIGAVVFFVKKKVKKYDMNPVSWTK